MAVLTISRQAGSNGTYIGKKVAENLGYNYIDKTHVAIMMNEYGFSNFDKTYDSIPTFWDQLDTWRDTTLKFLVEMEMAIAQHNNVVIAGRGGFTFLRPYNDVLNVRMKAPLEFRVREVARRLDMSPEDARTHVLRKDEIRKRFVESDMHFSYTDTTMFDIILDTSIVPVEDCVRVLTNGVNNRMSHPEDVQKSVKSIDVAPVLKDYVKEMLSRFTAEDSKA